MQPTVRPLRPIMLCMLGLFLFARSHLAQACNPDPPPDTPQFVSCNFQAGSNPRTIRLDWWDVDFVETYVLERSDDGATSWTYLGETGPGTTLYNDDDGLQYDNRYFYRVKAVNQQGSSEWSAVVSGSVYSQAAWDAAMMLTTSTNNMLHWSTEGISDWTIQDDPCHSSGSGGQSQNSHISNTSSTLAARVQGPGLLSFWVKGNGIGWPDQFNLWLDGGNMGGIGGSAWNRIVLPITDREDHVLRWAFEAWNTGDIHGWVDDVHYTTELDLPTGLAVQPVSTHTLRLTWYNLLDGSQVCEIHRSTNPYTTPTLVGTTGFGLGQYDDTGLTSGTRYYYRIRAKNGDLVSKLTAPVVLTFTVRDDCVPSASLAVTI